MALNEEQKLAVEHPVGHPACLIAGAGSGKTTTLTSRVKHLIDNEEVEPRKIAMLTFTNKAAGEMCSRLNIVPETPRELVPRVGTIHSLALAAIRKNPKGFGLQEKVTLLDDYDQGVMMKKILERHKKENLKPWVVLEKVSYHRARGIGFSVDYTEEIHDKALETHAGYHALEPELVELWRIYEQEKTKNSVLDFDDMLHLVVRRVRSDQTWAAAWSKIFDFILMDEAQDTNPVQWELVNSLLHKDNMNFMAVGDLNQCQPKGTKVKIVIDPPRGSLPAKLIEKNIEDIEDGDLAGNVWSKHDQYTYNAGRKIKTSKRWYTGSLISVSTNGKTTRTTPNHWFWVRFNKNCRDKHLVYLMYRSDLGFRVGLSKIKKTSTYGTYGLSYRMAQEKAEKGWVLRICDTRAEAECWEEIYSVKYGIPECCFDSEACKNRNAEHIKLIFSNANPEGGRKCLIDHNLLEEFPLAIRNENTVNGRRKYNQSWRGYFKCAAANIIPEIMDIPLERKNASTPITGTTRENFEGWVYSLDVEKNHTYVADGIIVGNSIYGFNGAEPKLLKEFSETWRGVSPNVYKLARNHRSVPQVVNLANAIQGKMVNTLPLKMESFRGINGEAGITKILKASTARDIATTIAYDIHRDNGLKRNPIPYKDNCILVRSSMQIRDIENELVRFRIPYVVRGGRGLLQTEEVRDVISYLKLAANVKDFMALNRAISIPKRGMGSVALEKIRKVADTEFSGDLIKACEKVNIDKLSSFIEIIQQVQSNIASPVAALERVVKLTNYENYIKEKYKKEPDRVRDKLENLERLALIIGSLVEDAKLNLEDIVFQLSMDSSQEDESVGKVTISTIHSAKGLEWGRVFVTNLHEGSLPHKFSMGSPDEIDEERRLFYVAVTRAKDTCVLCIPTIVMQGPNSHTVAPSRFLTEIKVINI